MQDQRILVVSDGLHAGRRLAVALGDAGYQNVLTCSSAGEALESLDHNKPALVISDIYTGGLDGFHLCRILKSLESRECEDIPVILFSESFRDSRAVSLAREAGAFAFLENPRDTERLFAIVAEALSGGREPDSEELGLGPVLRALIISGDRGLRDSLTRCLGSDGCRVVAARNATTAQHAVRHHEFDLVLVGDDSRSSANAKLIDWLCKFTKNAPVVVLRTVGDDGHWRELLEAGADDYLDQPVTRDDIRAACRRAHLRREFKSTWDRIESSENFLRLTEDHFRRQSGLLESLMEASGDGIVLCDARLRVATSNPAATKIFARCHAALIGCFVGELVGEDAARRFEDFLAKPVVRAERFEVDRTIDGQSKVLSIGLSCHESEGGTGLLLIVRDITKERVLRSKLAQSQKLESLGALAGGMAHDFNNILATILPNAERIATLCPGNELASERARAIEMAARRGGELTQRLLAFARPRSDSVSAADPNASVEGTVAMLRRTLDRKIRVEVDLMCDTAMVPIDPAQLEHALVNLAINARDAMPYGGTLCFKTWLNSVPGSTNGEEDLLVGILVEDSGIGMTEETKAKIFEPFFTTKSETGGTGLGLSMASEIVRSAKGFIEVETEPGEGTRFSIHLPVVARKAGRPKPRPALVRGLHERVLVVDDEEPVRELIAEMLTRLNYRVFSVASGAAAVEFCRREDMDLVVLDMIMPDLDGRETYRALKRIRPDLCIMLSSGDAQNPTIAALSADGVVAVQKPFTLARLSEGVRSALDCSRSSGPMGQRA